MLQILLAHARFGWKARVMLVVACAWLLLGRGCLAQRMVFAHYMLTNQDYQSNDDPTQEKKIEAYGREIQQAQSMGIDGFALNAGGWLKQTYYIEYAAQMFEAALRLHTGFKLMFSADMCCGNGADDVEDMMRRFAGNPRYASVYFRFKGRAVLTTFAGDKLGQLVWRQIRVDLERGTNPSASIEPEVLEPAAGHPSNAALPIFLVPAFFWGGELPTREQIQQGFDDWNDLIDGSFYWGIAGVPGSKGNLDPTKVADDYAAILHQGGKLFMAPICFQFWGANANRYYEYNGAEGMRAMWMDVFRVSHPEWVEIISWNDFIEGTYISPMDDPNKYAGANYLDASGIPLNERNYFHSHSGAAELLPFFIQWYKTGVEPKITRDAVYFFYRTQSVGTDAGRPSVAKKFGAVADRIYITANLTAPADLQIRMGEHVQTLHLGAGSTDAQVSFVVGTRPEFALVRKRKTLATGVGTDWVESAPRYNNYYYSSGWLTSAD
jgi:glucan endo-1,3-alpha-glucosidase